MLTVFLQII